MTNDTQARAEERACLHVSSHVLAGFRHTAAVVFRDEALVLRVSRKASGGRTWACLAQSRDAAARASTTRAA